MKDQASKLPEEATREGDGESMLGKSVVFLTMGG